MLEKVGSVTPTLPSHLVIHLFCVWLVCSGSLTRGSETMVGCWSIFSEWWHVDIIVLHLVEIVVKPLVRRARSGDQAASWPRSATSWWVAERSGTVVSWTRNTRGGLCRREGDIPTDCQYSLGSAPRLAVSLWVSYNNGVRQDGYLMRGLLWQKQFWIMYLRLHSQRPFWLFLQVF